MTDSKVTRAVFLKRLAALLIDLSIIYFTYVFLYTIASTIATGIFDLDPMQFAETSQPVRQTLFFLLSPVVYWVYSAFLESSRWQATIGKRILGLYVTDTDNNRIAFRMAAIRAGAKILIGIVPCNIFMVLLDSAQARDSTSMLYLPGMCMFGYLINLGMVLLTDRHQGVHDKLTRTFVVERQTKMPKIVIDQSNRSIIQQGDKNVAITGDNSAIFNDVQIDANILRNLPALVTELSKLRAKIKKQPPSNERNIAVAFLKAAEDEAKKGDVHKVRDNLSTLSKMTNIVKWVIDFAVQLGANFIADLLSHMAGLK